MDKEFEEGFYEFVRREAKGIVCTECMTYTLKAQRYKIINSIEADVTLKCERCNSERVVNMFMAD